jgi:hypothetical protein|tara:strand:- start:203 stop:451 length:249 start_codon:yes stop_codon:yes gene_type:complete
MSDTYTAKDVFDFASSGDASKTEDAFKGVLADKLQKRLEDKKIEMAQAMFSDTPTAEEPIVEPEAEPEAIVEPEPVETTETE